ncbi:hypothetical protein BDW75DRAFT_171463 [Aspergillus navahoensis]
MPSSSTWSSSASLSRYSRGKNQIWSELNRGSLALPQLHGQRSLMLLSLSFLDILRCVRPLSLPCSSVQGRQCRVGQQPATRKLVASLCTASCGIWSSDGPCHVRLDLGKATLQYILFTWLDLVACLRIYRHTLNGTRRPIS